MSDITSNPMIRDMIRQFDRGLAVQDDKLTAMTLKDFMAWMEIMVKGIACLALASIDRKYAVARRADYTAAQRYTQRETCEARRTEVSRWLDEWPRKQALIKDLTGPAKIKRKKNFSYIARCLRDGDWVFVSLAADSSEWNTANG